MNFGWIKGLTASLKSPYAVSRSAFTIVWSKMACPSELLKNSISRFAPAMRFAIFASSSVPRPRSRSSSSSKLGGWMKRNSGFGTVFQALLTNCTPCTSMSKMQTFPSSHTDWTDPLLVP